MRLVRCVVEVINVNLNLVDSCNSCSSECITCTSGASCNSCEPGSYCTSCQNSNMNAINGKCKCPEKYYKESSECFPCVYPCESCSSADYCLSCLIESTSAINGTCECISGFYDASPDSNDTTCLPCEDSCEICLSSKECLKCKDECVCIENYFMNQSGLCEHCNESCLSCQSKTECRICINSTYELIDNSKCLLKCQSNSTRIQENCICNAGFKLENSECIDYFFDFEIQLDTSNKISILFSEPLLKTLKPEDIKIIFSYNLDFNIKQDSTSKFSIIFNFKKSISSGLKLSVELNDQIYSSNNAKLKSYSFNVLLNEFIYIDPMIKEFISTFKSTAKIVVTTSIGISIVSNPAAAWALIGTLQLLPYIPLSKFYKDKGTTEFFTSSGELISLPNIMVYVFDKNSSQLTYDRAKLIGIETSVFWINIGGIILPLILLLCAWPLMHYISHHSTGKLKSILRKLSNNYKFSVFFRFWVQAYLDIGVFSIIQLKSVKNI